MKFSLKCRKLEKRIGISKKQGKKKSNTQDIGDYKRRYAVSWQEFPVKCRKTKKKLGSNKLKIVNFMSKLVTS